MMSEDGSMEKYGNMKSRGNSKYEGVFFWVEEILLWMRGICPRIRGIYDILKKLKLYNTGYKNQKAGVVCQERVVAGEDRGFGICLEGVAFLCTGGSYVI